MSLFLVLLQSLVDDKSDADRLLPIAQTAIDAGDPASWGAHIFRHRLDDMAPPSVLSRWRMKMKRSLCQQHTH